jgi:hypothetical protein
VSSRVARVALTLAASSDPLESRHDGGSEFIEHASQVIGAGPLPSRNEVTNELATSWRRRSCATETRDHDGVRSRLTWGGNLPAVVSLLAVAVMSWAAFLPCVQSPWPGTQIGFSAERLPIGPLPTASLARGPDAYLVFVILVVMGVAAAAHFVGVRRRVAGVTSFGAALAVALAGIYPTVGLPGQLDYGLYAFVAGATVAAIAGLVMVVMSFRGTRLAVDTALPAVIALLAVSLMSWASFLPYVQFPWTDGGISLPSGSALPAGPLPTSSLAQGPDAYLVLVTLAVLGAAAATHLVGIRRRVTGVASFGASLIAVAIALIYPAILGVPAPIDYGFYPFVAGATVAVISGLVMMVMSFRGARPAMATAQRPTCDQPTLARARRNQCGTTPPEILTR